MKDDEELILSYLNGDDKSLSVLIDRYLNDAYFFAYSLTNDLSLSQDIIQEAFIKTWNHIRLYKNGGNFKSWLFAIVRNTAIDNLRKKKNIPFSFFENKDGDNFFVDSLKSDEPLADELISKAENEVYINLLLKEINPDYAEIITLKYYNDMTFKEIGEMLSKPMDTVKSQYRRGMISLKRILNKKSI